MSKGRTWSGYLTNIALAVAAVVLTVLLIGLGSRLMEPPVTTARTTNPQGLVGGIVQVDVRNGAGAPGMAGVATAFLRRQGFDVVESGNWRRFDVEQTHVIDRVGNPEAALRVARALGLDEARITEDLDPRFFVDATVVIGHDYTSLPSLSP